MKQSRTVAAFAVATALLVLVSGTGSFTAHQADRPAQLAIADDDSALIGYDAACEAEFLGGHVPGLDQDDDLLDLSVLANRSAGSDDDVVDAAIGARKSARSDDDVVDAAVLSNKSSYSDADLVDLDVLSGGTHLGLGDLLDLLGDVELTVTITNKFERPLEGSVTVDEATRSIGPISPGQRENVTFDDGFEPGGPIVVKTTRPTRATLERTVPDDCHLLKQLKDDWESKWKDKWEWKDEWKDKWEGKDDHDWKDGAEWMDDVDSAEDDEDAGHVHDANDDGEIDLGGR